MAMAYDTSRFKAHVETCAFSTAAGGIRTLETHGFFPVSAPPVGSTIRPSSLLPHVTVIALASPTKAIDAFHSTSNGRQ
jgi:hypothetical protein